MKLQNSRCGTPWCPVLTLCLAVVISCAACQSRFLPIDEPSSHVLSLLHTPAELPSFLSNVQPSPGATLNSVEKICATVVGAVFVQIGDTTDIVDNRIVETTRFIINDQPLSWTTYVNFGISRNLVEVVNGVATGAIIVCFDGQFAPGIYHVQIRINKTSSELLFYEWVFEVED